MRRYKQGRQTDIFKCIPNMKPKIKGKTGG